MGNLLEAVEEMLRSINIIPLVTALGPQVCGLCSSNSEARRLIKQGGIRVDGKTINTEDYLLTEGEYLLQVGKQGKVAKLIVPCYGTYNT